VGSLTVGDLLYPEEEASSSQLQLLYDIPTKKHASKNGGARQEGCQEGWPSRASEGKTTRKDTEDERAQEKETKPEPGWWDGAVSPTYTTRIVVGADRP